MFSQLCKVSEVFIVQTISNNIAISIDWYQLISDLAPTIVAIFSIFLTYKLAKDNYKSDIAKIKINSTIEVCIKITDDLINLLEDRFTLLNQTNKTKYIKDLQNNICVYGSTDMIKIFAHYKQFTYLKDLNNPKNNPQQFAFFCLMWMQMKLDISNQYVDPLDYLKMKVTDYSKQDDLVKNIKQNINLIVKELNLDDKFIQK